MPFEDNKILEFSQYQKTDKALFIILADLEYLIEKINECKNKPENSSTATLGKLIHQVFQCLQYHHLKAQKIIMIYVEVKIARKRFVNSQESTQ